MNIVSRNKHRIPLKSILAVAALQLCLFSAPVNAFASDIIVVKDAEIKPYRDAIEGFKSSCNCTVREFYLSDIDAIERAIKERPDAVVAVGTQAFRKLKAIKNVPLIYIMVIPPEMADSLGDNVSGVSMDIAPEAYLDSITGLFPDAKRIGVLFDPEHTGAFVRDSAASARAKGIMLVKKAIRDPRQMPALLNELRNKVDVLWMLPDETLIDPDTIDYLMLFSFQNNMPLFSFSKKYVEHGAAAALKINPFDMGVQAGELAQVLLQRRGGHLRVYARSPKLIVNRKVCAKLGVRFNDDIVRHAENVE